MNRRFEPRQVWIIEEDHERGPVCGTHSRVLYWYLESEAESYADDLERRVPVTKDRP